MPELTAVQEELVVDSELAEVLAAATPAPSVDHSDLAVVTPEEVESPASLAGVPGGSADAAEAPATVPGMPADAGESNPASRRSGVASRLVSAVREHLPAARRSLAGWAGGALCALALFSVLFVGYLGAFSRLEASRAQTHLIASLNGTGGLASLTAVVPAEGQPAGVLTIPALGLDDVIVAGTSSQDLEEGPGFLIGSAPPGTRGNTVLAGKRASFGGPFGNIGSLRRGDPVDVVGSLGSFTYKVVSAGTAIPGWPDPAGPGDRAQLTLVTADSSLVPGGLEYVVATLVGKPVAYVAPTAIVPPSASLGLDGDSNLVLPTLFWFLLLALAGIATAVAVRRCRKAVTVYVISAPIVLALCMVVFHDLAGMLPATL